MTQRSSKTGVTTVAKIARAAEAAGRAAADIEVQPDGRKRRSQSSQRRIVAALLELVGEGHVTPSAEQVAERAGVGLRSVFRHFKDMDSLYREMSGSIAATLEDAVRQPFAAADWRGQALELIDRRAATFEKLGPYLRASQVHRHRSAFLRAGHARFVQVLREFLLDRLPADENLAPDMVEAIDMMLSFEAWQRLRHDQGLDVSRAKRVLKASVGVILERGKAPARIQR